MMIRFFLPLVLAAVISGCASLPRGIEPVAEFDLNAYLGKWYEIARLENRFERGLEKITAEYSLRDDGGVEVINRGYSTAEGQWKEITGKASPVGSGKTGHLKVSFFGPFYGTYCVFELGPGGRYAFVAGANRKYLWLLSRKPSVSKADYRRFLERAGALGFDTGKLVVVDHG